MDQISNLIADRAPIFAAVAVLLGAVFLFSTFKSSKYDATTIPLVGKEIGNAEERRKQFISNARGTYEKGYALFRENAWRHTDTDGTSYLVSIHV